MKDLNTSARTEVPSLTDEIVSFLRCNSDQEYTFALLARKLDVSEYRIAEALKELLFWNKITFQLKDNAQSSKNESRYRTK